MRFLKISLIFLLVLSATVAGAYLRFKEVFRPRPFNEEIEQNGTPVQPATRIRFDSARGTVNILVVGLDDVDGGRRSDAIALAILNEDKRTVRVASIPRDSRVQIPGYSWEKINHAYAYGGIELLKNTVMNLLGIDVNYFIVVNYQSFPRIIDLLGGIDIYVEKKLEYTDYSGKLFINIPAGQQHMNGKTALDYVRFRHDPLGDIGRVQRQQKFISIVMNKLKSPSVLPKIPTLVNEVVTAVNTDMTPMEALRFAQFANSLPLEKIKLFMAPGKATYIGNVSYWIINIPEFSRMLVSDDSPEDSAFVSEDLSPELTYDNLLELVTQIGKIGILNGDGASGLGRKASQIFQKLGIDVAYTGNARHFDYHTTNVVYPETASESDKQAAEALAKLCGVTNKALIRKDRTVSMVSIILGHDKDIIFKRLEDAGFR